MLGTEAAAIFFPTGDVVGQTIRVGDVPVKVVGAPRGEGLPLPRGPAQHLRLAQPHRRACPSTLVARRIRGTATTASTASPSASATSTRCRLLEGLSDLLHGNHRQQDDFRLDDVAARVRKQRSQGDVYNIIFMLSGVLSLIGGGIVNVNIQMASLKERVREVGVKMAIGASGREIFKGFMTEALLLTGARQRSSASSSASPSRRSSRRSIGVPLYMDPKSFVWAFVLAVGLRLPVRALPGVEGRRLSPDGGAAL